MRVLLLEHDPQVCGQLKLTLKAIPGTELVKEAHTAQEARTWLQEHPHEWDLAVVDVFVQQGGGFEVLRRCHRRAPHQRAVVLSSYTRDPVRQYAREAGADAVFDQTCEMEALVEYLIEWSSRTR
jgi:DNA-binding NarL/FixJ family response regulator